MDKNKCGKLQNELKVILQDFCNKNGLYFASSKASYGDCSAEFSFSVREKNETGAIELSHTQNEGIKRALAYSHDGRAPARVIGETFEIRNLGKCKIVDYKPRASKFPFIVETVRGETYKVHPSSFIY